jgi:hypothetical protein
MDKRIDREINRHINKKMDRLMVRHRVKQIDRWTGILMGTYNRTDRQTGIWTNDNWTIG